MKLVSKTRNTPVLIALAACLCLVSGAAAVPDATSPAGEEVHFSQAELDQMLAPVALYPDVLLSQVLMAATYPLDVVEASRWSKANDELEGDDAVLAVEEQAWDQSVKALVGFPELIQLMDENLAWTRRLGEAFLAQEEQVMETVQQLRAKALDEGNLASLEHVTVEQKDREIVIEPANLEVVYVPYYRPTVVYGGWWWADFPPYYWDVYPRYYSSIGFSWSHGYRVSTSFYYSTCSWPRRSVVVINPRRSYDRYDYKRLQFDRRYNHYRDRWQHDSSRRSAVDYRRKVINDRIERFGDQVDRVDRPHTVDRVNRVDRTRTVDRVDRVDRTRTLDRVDRVDRGNQVNRPERIDRTQRHERIDRTQRPERVDRTQRPERPAVVATRPKPTPPAARPTVPDRQPRPAPPVQVKPPRSNDSSGTTKPSYSRWVAGRQVDPGRQVRDANRQPANRAPIRNVDP
jgi:hypothetical protein